MEYTGFLGTWILDPRTCDYEQGEPPQSGVYTIEELEESVLRFTIEWVDSEDKTHKVVFEGPATGEPIPFAGGELADSLSIRAVSTRELTTSASYGGKELMVAQRQLDESGQAMRVIQLVRLPDGTAPTNISVYRRRMAN